MGLGVLIEINELKVGFLVTFGYQDVEGET
jgi:hypothetical protein